MAERKCVLFLEVPTPTVILSDVVTSDHSMWMGKNYQLVYDKQNLRLLLGIGSVVFSPIVQMQVCFHGRDFSLFYQKATEQQGSPRGGGGTCL